MCELCVSLDVNLALVAAGEPVAYPAAPLTSSALGTALTVIPASQTEDADAASGTMTAYAMQVDDVFAGTIAASGDTDWVAIELVAGQSYVFTQWGVGGSADGLRDTKLSLYDSSGSVLATNDDIAEQWGTLFSAIQFTAPATGTYYLEAGAYLNRTGDYHLMAADALYSVEQAATYLIEVDWGSPAPIHFATETVYVNITELQPDAQQLARWALEEWAIATGLTFVETDDPDLTNIMYVDDDPGAFAGPQEYDPVTGINTYSEVNIGNQWVNYYGTTVDSYSYQTYLHETGHALGLGHLGPYDGTATFGVDNLIANDSTIMSVMSYFDPPQNPNVEGEVLSILTPMRADLAAVHAVYGQPEAYAGDTVWGAGSNVGGWMGDLFAILFDGAPQDGAFYEGEAVALTLFDTGGTDLVDLSTVTADQRIDLTPGAVSDIGGVVSALSIDITTIIENARGGSGHDAITGNAADNILEGGAGDDTIMGGAGIDTAVLAVASGDVTADISGASIIVSSALGSDMFTSVEFFAFDDMTLSAAELLGGQVPVEPMAGTEGNDTLTGTAGADVITGFGGDDALFGLGGDDTIDGGAGNDNIGAGDGADSVTGGDGDDSIGGGTGNDTLYGEGGDDFMGGGMDDDYLSGGTGNDVVNGGAGDDVLYGDDGNDTMGASLGADTVYGGEGNDDIGGGAGTDYIEGGAGNDSVGGGEGDDTIYGGGGDDFLAGGGRHDVIRGGDGDDTINGGDGNDTMSGGAGADQFNFNFDAFTAPRVDVIEDFEIGVDSFLMIGVDGGLSSLYLGNILGGIRIGYEDHVIEVMGDGLSVQTLEVDDFTFV
ncbi:serralysin [Rhodovulum bhavnagarense]|uniref:Serralysin n=1 Tax=Rhodovulum bhavnagarense TaxID=992286 RepID=A0A4R2RF98_9RHOB|nr:M10 family metallopeptidase C-terminal domain-containing protein [Rhodovulum bhavnagarense]TCP61553.1 serralysin [Rhodovulum bhavnagarense]